MAGSPMDRIFAGVGSIFGRGQQSDPTKGNPTVPGPGANVNSDGTVIAIPKAATGEQSPLENYAELFTVDPENPVVHGVKSPLPPFKLDQKLIADTAGTLDYTKGITDAELNVLYPNAPVEAARKAMNKLGANAFETNFTVGAQTMERAMTNQTRELMDKTIPEVIRRQQVTSLTSDTSYAKDPLTAPVFDMLKAQFTDKFPDASPQQISHHTQKYMENMMNNNAKAQGKEIRNTPKPRIPDTDFSEFDDEPQFGSQALFN